MADSTLDRSVLLCIIFMLAGCGNRANTTQDGWVEITDGNGAASIKEITLPSGRKCVAMIGYYKSALTCDWGR